MVSQKPAEMNFQGTLRVKKENEVEYSPLTQILNKYIFSYQAGNNRHPSLNPPGLYPFV